MFFYTFYIEEKLDETVDLICCSSDIIIKHAFNEDSYDTEKRI